MLLCYAAMAQDDSDTAKANEASLAYHETRLDDSDPPFSLNKILELISKLKPTETEVDDVEIVAPDQQTYLSLTLHEKFTYHMVHPESYSQNCDGMPAVVNEEKKIFGQLLDGFGEYSWSERQRIFFLANRDSVIALMKYCIMTDKKIGLNFKHVIVDVSATQLIPLIIETYSITKKDHDLLTVLLLLMKNNEFPPFLISSSFKKLYGNKDANYKAYLNFNNGNEALIIKRATDFYSGLPK